MAVLLITKHRLYVYCKTTKTVTKQLDSWSEIAVILSVQ